MNRKRKILSVLPVELLRDISTHPIKYHVNKKDLIDHTIKNWEDHTIAIAVAMWIMGKD